ncbi:MAG: hypothetical protein WDW36_002092 [Sanguina aurantia]
MGVSAVPPLTIGVAMMSAVGLVWMLASRSLKRPTNYWDSLAVFRLKNNKGMEVQISSVGAAIMKLSVPDKRGQVADVVLGYDDASTYAIGEPVTYFGVVVGRCANRIAGAKFTLLGKEYKLLANNGPNALHGGSLGLHKRVWEGHRFSTDTSVGVALSYDSPEGEEGYPGHVRFTVTYTLASDRNELTCLITATTDTDTPINVAQHSYFNLNGHASGSILGHTLHMPGADHMTPVGSDMIPTGRIAPVEGTPFDFRQPRAFAERIDQVPGGYDHNYVLNNMGPQARFIVRKGIASSLPKLAATVRDPQSGRAMDVSTTAPGVQLYTGNFLGGEVIGKGGASYQKHDGFCLETQALPNSVNEPTFPSVIITPADKYRHETVYRFYNT